MASNTTTKNPREPINGALANVTPYIAQGKLAPVGVRTNPVRYIRDLWQRRAYIWFDSRMKVRTQNSNHKLGSFWLLAKPTLDIIFYGVVFGLILKATRGIDNFVAYIIVGVLMFQYMAGVINNAATVMNQGKTMMRAFSFPRMALPISMLVRQTLHMGPIIAVMLLALMAIPPHILPTTSWLLFLPGLALNSIFLLGLALIIARYAYVVPDLQQVLSFITRILMYGSGVLFPIEQFISNPLALAIIHYNPVYVFLNLYRALLLDGQIGSGQTWLVAGSWALGTFLVGFFIFWRAEEVFGRELR